MRCLVGNKVLPFLKPNTIDLRILKKPSQFFKCNGLSIFSTLINKTLNEKNYL